MEHSRTSLSANWQSLGKILVSPDSLFLILAVIAIITVSFFTDVNKNPVIMIIMMSVISLLASILGAILSRRWTENQHLKTLQTRGHSGIRGLNLILSHIYSIKKRVATYMYRLGREEYNYELHYSQFEEILEKCNNLFEDSVSAIEEWQDVIPEANLKHQVGHVSQLRTEVNRRMQDLSDMRRLSEKMDKEMNEADRADLKVTIQKLETVLNNLEDSLKFEEGKVLIDQQFFVYCEGKLQFSNPEFPKIEAWEEPMDQLKLVPNKKEEMKLSARNN